MSVEKRNGPNGQIVVEAAEWLVEFRAGDIDSAGRRDFDAWLRASPEHIRAFLEMALLWDESGAIDAQRRIDVEALIARAQSESNVIALNPAAAADGPPGLTAPGGRTGAAGDGARGSAGRARSGRSVKWAAAAGLLAAGLTAALMVVSGHFGSPTYTTGVGAQRSIRLDDGSTVLLDSRSRLRVSFTAATREVYLLRGQALFDVVKNPRRPFLVRAGNAVVRDLGTVFDVNRRTDATVVTVVEGRVAVAVPSATASGMSATFRSREPSSPGRPAPNRAGASAALPIVLSGGEQLDLRVGELMPRPTRVDVGIVTAWTHGQVVLQSATLQQVAQVFNRYSKRKLVAQDFGRHPLRLSGVFTTNPDFLIQYLSERPDIVVTETPSQIDIVRRPVK